MCQVGGGWAAASLPSQLSRARRREGAKRAVDGRVGGVTTWGLSSPPAVAVASGPRARASPVNQPGRWGDRGVRRRSSSGFSRRRPVARDGLLCSLVGERERESEREITRSLLRTPLAPTMSTCFNIHKFRLYRN